MRKNFILFLSLTALIFYACAPKVSLAPELAELSPVPDASLWNYLRQGRPEKVLSRTEGNKDGLSLAMRGFAYLQLKNLELAEKSFKAAVEAGETTFGWLGLGMVYERRGNLLEAYRCYRKASSHPYASRKLSQLAPEAARILLERAGDDVDALLEALSIAPDSPEIYLRISEVYRQRGEDFLAMVYLEKARKRFPENSRILLAYIELLQRKGEYEKALRALEEGASALDEDLYRRIKKELVEGLERKRIESRIKPVLSKAYITRADLAVLVDAYAGDFLPEPGRPPIITDLYDTWSRDSIIRVAAWGIMEVYPDHTFMPDEKVTRRTFALVIEKILRLTGLIERAGVGGVELADVPEGSRFYRAASLAVGLGFMKAEGGRFRPADPVLPQEAVQSMALLREFLKRNLR